MCLLLYLLGVGFCFEYYSVSSPFYYFLKLKLYIYNIHTISIYVLIIIIININRASENWFSFLQHTQERKNSIKLLEGTKKQLIEFLTALYNVNSVYR